jgi:hypothetical protein
MKPEFLFGIAFNIAYWIKKYHSGTICAGVTKGFASKELSGCDSTNNPNVHWKKYRAITKNNENTSFSIKYGKKGILLLVEYLIGLDDDKKCKIQRCFREMWYK